MNKAYLDTIQFLKVVYKKKWLSWQKAVLLVCLSIFLGLPGLLATVSLLPVIVLYIRPKIIIENLYFIEFFGLMSVDRAAFVVLTISLLFLLCKFFASLVQIKQAIEYCSLEPLIHKKEKELLQTISIDDDNLSTGEKQRIALARSLYQHRDVYVFDEPTANVNTEYAQKFFEFFNDIGSESTVVVVTHNPNTIASNRWRFYPNEGKLRELSSVESLPLAELGR